MVGKIGMIWAPVAWALFYLVYVYDAFNEDPHWTLRGSLFGGTLFLSLGFPYVVALFAASWMVASEYRGLRRVAVVIAIADAVLLVFGVVTLPGAAVAIIPTIVVCLAIAVVTVRDDRLP